jgi:hypothetical protein
LPTANSYEQFSYLYADFSFEFLGKLPVVAFNILEIGLLKRSLQAIQ